MGGKIIHENTIIGEQGIALIHSRVSKMGFLWHPTGVEAGIDGFIEIRDTTTGAVRDHIIQVQSKATAGRFDAETATTCAYRCSQKDIDYWMAGNAPVILVLSRPKDDEAYWVSIKDYFRDPARRRSKLVVFDRAKNRFDGTAKDELIRLATPPDSGIYFPTAPRQESLYSNLLPVGEYPPRLFFADTDFRERDELQRHLRLSFGCSSPEWVLHGGKIWTFHDLDAHPWRTICDLGTRDELETDEWAYSRDGRERRLFVELLNYCLEAKLNPEVTFERGAGYFFAATKDLSDLRIYYRSRSHDTHREVFKAYRNKLDPTRVAYYRHSGFLGHFQRHDEQWYLEVTPTYHFTSDGYARDPFGSERMKNIKRLERNLAVLGQFLMWSWWLTQPPTLFRPAYPFLTFRSPLTCQIEFGLDDREWLKHDDPASQVGDVAPADAALFEKLDED